MANLDTDAIWILWACPVCQTEHKDMLHTVGFGMDIDLTVNDHGAVNAYMETTCFSCDTWFQRSLSKER